MLQTLKDLYERRQKPLAAVLLAVMLVGGILENAALQAAAIVAFLALILHVLLDIQHTTGSRGTPWYDSFQSALPDITDEVERRLRRGRSVRLRWLGVTQEAGWPATQNILLRVLDGSLGSRCSLRIELGLMDPLGSVCNSAAGPNRGQIETTMRTIKRFAAERRSQLGARQSSIAVFPYDHRPTWHAVLVDEDVLYFSLSLPANLAFSAPQGGVEVVKQSDGEAAAQRVRHFAAWFEEVSQQAVAAGRAFVSVCEDRPAEAPRADVA